MIPWGFDTETFPIRPGRQAPRVVCLQADRSIYLRPQGLERLRARLADPQVLIFGHEVAFDVLATIATDPTLLLPWLEALDADRVVCTREREALIRIAKGTSDRCQFDLVSCVERYKIPHDFQDGDKDTGGVRTRYHELDGLPVESWPERARRYALADLVVEDLFHAQEAYAPPEVLADQFRQTRAAVWARMDSAHGMRVDPRAVAHFAERTEAEHRTIRAALGPGDPGALADFCRAWNQAHPDARRPLEPVPFAGGLVRAVGSKDTKAAAARMREVCAREGLPVPITKTGKERLEKGEAIPVGAYTALDADACLATGDPVLIAYARFTSIGTLRSRAERLRRAGELGLPIQPRFTVLKKTGRMSCSGGDVKPGQEIRAFGDQTQNLPRSPGLRECYTARPGCVIISVDWKAAELGTLAQTCLDLGLDSELARVLNSGRDVHLWYAALLLGVSYEFAAEALAGKHGADWKKKAKKARQDAKPCNFGFPGGLGIQKFRLFAAKQYQAFFTDAEATERRQVWLSALPEMPHYFRHVSDLIDSGRPLIHFKSGRYRGDLRYTSAANSYFQGRCSDMLKDAGWRVTLAIHRDGLPARIWNNAHDELLIEAPESAADPVARTVVEIMEGVSREWCPGAPPAAEPAIQYSWRKGAEPAYDSSGRLIPHENRALDAEAENKIREMIARGETPLYTSWVAGVTEARVLEIAA